MSGFLDVLVYASDLRSVAPSYPPNYSEDESALESPGFGFGYSSSDYGYTTTDDEGDNRSMKSSRSSAGDLEDDDDDEEETMLTETSHRTIDRTAQVPPLNIPSAQVCHACQPRNPLTPNRTFLRSVPPPNSYTTAHAKNARAKFARRAAPSHATHAMHDAGSAAGQEVLGLPRGAAYPRHKPLARSSIPSTLEPADTLGSFTHPGIFNEANLAATHSTLTLTSTPHFELPADTMHPFYDALPPPTADALQAAEEEVKSAAANSTAEA